MDKRILKKFIDSRGFSLNEITIYIGIIAVISVMIITIIVQLVQLKNRSTSIAIISTEASNFIEKLINDVRDCDEFILVNDTTLQVNKDSITKEYYLQDDKIYYTESGNTYPLTTNQINIAQLKFTDWTSVNSDNLLHIEVEIERGGINETFQTSVHKR